VDARRIAAWDGSAWSPLGTGLAYGASLAHVYALTPHAGDLLAGGEFTTADGMVSAYWARWGPVGPFDPADFNHNCDVDRDDFNLFEACATGPGIPLNPGCENRDFDNDADVDQSDFAVFQRCYSGENVPANPSFAE
jgi:hypothetical protein